MVFEAIKTQIAGRVAFGEKVRYYFSSGGKKIHRSCCEEGDVPLFRSCWIGPIWPVPRLKEREDEVPREARESEVPI